MSQFNKISIYSSRYIRVSELEIGMDIIRNDDEPKKLINKQDFHDEGITLLAYLSYDDNIPIYQRLSFARIKTRDHIRILDQNN